MHEEGLIDRILDVQSFDLDAALSLKNNHFHHQIGATYYASYLVDAAVNQLDFVILSALEIDTDFNVNVLTGSDGVIRGAVGGHPDTAEAASLSVVVAPLTRGRIPSIVKHVNTVVTPGEVVDVVVTDQGIAVNPRREDVRESSWPPDCRCSPSSICSSAPRRSSACQTPSATRIGSSASSCTVTTRSLTSFARSTRMTEPLGFSVLPQALRAGYAELLTACGLRDEGDSEWTVVLPGEDDTILACGSLSGKILKQLAVRPEASGGGACAAVVTALLQEALRRGVTHPFLYTKPANVRMFRSMGFYPIAQTAEMCMMERRRDGLARYLAAIPPAPEAAAVVCNCNPFTLGHLHLIETAAAENPAVYVFVLSEENGGMFSAADRLHSCAPGRRSCRTSRSFPAGTI